MPEGVIASFDEESGRGQIAPQDGSEDVIFDINDLQSGRQGEPLQPNQPVTYQVEDTAEGTRAVNVQILSERGYG